MVRAVFNKGEGWASRTMTGGRFTPITELLASGTHTLEYWGNSKEGWACYLCSAAMPDVGIAISPVFAREFGDTLRDLKAAARRAYGETITIRRGRA